ncbi:hypothetical protein KXW60_001730 [Aspergillus fumigatus]|nr:hypothetical protein KXW60_001730 [Aspergillus fumigatus]KAH3270950.1 hypothetical protein KXW55_001790 [Aspergillus fumigatus]
MCFGLCEYDDERYSPPRRSNYPGYNYSGPNNCNYNYGYDNAAALPVVEEEEEEVAVVVVVAAGVGVVAESSS